MGHIRSSAVAQLEASARANLGLFTVADAKRCGVSAALVGYHGEPGGRWSRVLPGVYELTALPPSRRRSLLAALLWAGDAAILSHRAAATVLGLDGMKSPQPELWAHRGRVPKGVIVHRGSVPAVEATTTGLLRHTSLVRTVLDVATVLDDDTLELAVESAIRVDRAAERRLREVASTGRPGGPRLGRVLGRRPPGAPPTESELETRYLQVIRLVDVPPPVRQHRVVDRHGHPIARLDLCWPQVGLWVELDGRAWHEHPNALFADRHRQNALLSTLQWQILRFTWDDVINHPGATARATETAYRRRSLAAGRRS